MRGRAKYTLAQPADASKSEALSSLGEAPLRITPSAKIVEVAPRIFISTVFELDKPASRSWLRVHEAFVIQLLYSSELGHALEHLEADQFSIVCFSDSLTESICDTLEEILQIMASQHESGKKIVVCDITGRSRPPTVLIAWLMQRERLPLLPAWTQIRDAYPNISLSLDMSHALLRCNSIWECGTAGSTAMELTDLYPSALCRPSPAPGMDFHGRLRDLFVYKSMDYQDASLILPGVWIGNEAASACTFWLKFHKITRIINCAEEVYGGTDAMLRDAGILGVTRLCIEETEEFEALEPLMKGVEALRRARNAKEKVLVHCALGINRSVSTVAAYIMTEFGVSLLDALTFIRARRPIARPNAEMYPYLLKLESQLFGSTSVPMEAVNEHFPY